MPDTHYSSGSRNRGAIRRPATDEEIARIKRDLEARNATGIRKHLLEYRNSWIDDPGFTALATLAIAVPLGVAGAGILGTGPAASAFDFEAGAESATGAGASSFEYTDLASAADIMTGSTTAGGTGTGATAAGGSGILEFLKNIFGSKKGAWLPYLLALGSSIPSAKSKMFGKEMYERGKMNYDKYMNAMSNILQARSAEHNAIGNMITGGVNKNSTIPSFNYADLFSASFSSGNNSTSSHPTANKTVAPLSGRSRQSVRGSNYNFSG